MACPGQHTTLTGQHMTAAGAWTGRRGRTADAVLGGAKGQLNERRADAGGWQRVAGLEPLQRVGAHDLGVRRARVLRWTWLAQDVPCTDGEWYIFLRRRVGQRLCNEEFNGELDSDFATERWTATLQRDQQVTQVDVTPEGTT